MDDDTVDGETVEQAMSRRSKYAKHIGDSRSVNQRLTDFVRLQKASFEVLSKSPDGYHNFLRRNYHSRRVEVVHGEFRPVSPDRRAQQA